jgi:DNA polymerase-3 subunit beta
MEIAKVLPEETSAKIVRKAKDSAEITSGRSKFRLSGIDASEFPELPEKPTATPVSIDAALLGKMLESVVPFVATDETRYNLSGVLMENLKDSTFRMVATDGSRMALADGKAAEIDRLLPSRNILVSRKGIQEIRRLAESDPGMISLSASDKFLYVSMGDTEVWVRLLEEKFPSYKEAIPEGYPHSAIIGRDAFDEVLRRMDVMSPDTHHDVKLVFSGEKLEVSTSDPEKGEAQDVLEANYSGPGFTIGFNGRYLRDAGLHCRKRTSSWSSRMNALRYF